MSGILVGQLILWLIVAIIAIVIAVYIVNWLYHRSSKEVSFVRTGFLGEQRVVAAPADVDAGMELGAALPHDDLPGLDDLTAEPLDAQPLSGGIPTVARARGALLVCHVCRPYYLIPVTFRTVSC